MKIGSLFSGIGGLELGLEMVIPGAVVRWQAESDPAARNVLASHWPGVRIYEDVRDIDEAAEHVDIICGGFPCQDLSVAGKGAGLGAERSGLWWEFRRIVRTLRPRFVLIENVHRGWRRWVPVVRRSLWRVGYASVPVRVRASDVGAPHERSRCFVVAYAVGQQLRIEPWGRGWKDRAREAFSAIHGEARSYSDADREGQPQPARRVEALWGRSCNGDGWDPEPVLVGKHHGVSGRLDRERLLGNTAVPQCAAYAWTAVMGSQVDDKTAAVVAAWRF